MSVAVLAGYDRGQGRTKGFFCFFHGGMHRVN